MTPDTVVVEPATSNDAAAVARLHAEGIGEGFLSTLGPRFLAVLYRAMAQSGDAVLLVARRDGRVIGFAAGAAEPRLFYREFLRRKALRASIALMPRALRPSVVIGIAETLRHLRSGGERAAELLAVAVGSSVSGTGFGAALVFRLEEELRAAGATRLAVVVSATNASARAFYERLGFAEPTPIQIHRGARSVRYVKPLSAAPRL